VPFVLLIGFLMGVRHALEADHLAAVATLASRRRGVVATMVQGTLWGIGHAAALLAVAVVVVLCRVSIPDRIAHGLEALVGVMLIGLGLSVLWRLRRGRLHVHVHRHGDGTMHVHAHAHARGERHDPDRHAHAHARGGLRPALLVGVMHGMAGSAALLVLVAMRFSATPMFAIAFVALFGAGATLGMAALSAVIAVPLAVSNPALSRGYRGMHAVIGVASIAIGAWVLVGALAPGGALH